METVTVHAIGKCPIKGCKARRRNSFTGRVVRDRHGAHTLWGIPSAYGEVAPYVLKLPARPSTYAENVYEAAFVAAMREHGWTCETHDRFMAIVTVRGTVNFDKPCTARCKSATGPNCECVCGGEGHGAAFI